MTARCQCGRPLPDSVDVFVRDEGAERIAELEAALRDESHECQEARNEAKAEDRLRREAEDRIAELEATIERLRCLTIPDPPPQFESTSEAAATWNHGAETMVHEIDNALNTKGGGA